MMLSPQEFPQFFQEVHGVEPFPWQKRLLQRLAQGEEWPATLDLPTGSGKTAVIDIAVFHLALQANAGVERKAPVRIAFVVDRRLVVDEAYSRARRLETALRNPASGSATEKVSACLRTLSLDGPPLLVRRLRGGIPREDDWARTPSQPTVLCSTVDQIGSRLLFRGYGVSDSMKPVHAGLIGSDCLIFLDEAHLSEPFRQTLEWVKLYRSGKWRQSTYRAPFGVSFLTATPAPGAEDSFILEQDDKEHPVLKQRLEASKPTKLIRVGDETARQEVFVSAVKQAITGSAKAIGIVVNRVARARALFEKLRLELQEGEADLVLMIGPARPIQRDQIADRLNPIRTAADSARASLNKPIVIVATQTIEVGVDVDLDAMFTEPAPLDALRQRFGRLNRSGRSIVPSSAIVAIDEEITSRGSDPVYGNAVWQAWKTLDSQASSIGKGRNKQKIIDFGLNHFPVSSIPPEALSPKADAPVLMPAHLDLLSQTCPVPTADPDVALYLHGPSRQLDAVTVIWRADISPEWEDQDVPRLLAMVPPRAGEAIELPVWVVRYWLSQDKQARHANDLADVASTATELQVIKEKGRKVFLWKGLDERSRWATPDELSPGDTVIVPAAYGGVDDYGWHPDWDEKKDKPVSDLANIAAISYCGRRFAVRVAPGLLGKDVAPDALSRVLANVQGESWEVVRDVLMRLALPDDLKSHLKLLAQAKRKRGRSGIEVHFDLYGYNATEEPRGVVFLAPLGLINGATEEDGRPNATEDDASGSLYGFAQALTQHSAEVESKAEDFARAAGLPSDRIADLKLSGFLHDQGKRDSRFQRWLYHGDPLGADSDDESTILAKSGRPLPPDAREKAGLPPYWRHEALSVRLARTHARLRDARDADLVLWLVGTHHGYGRPLFPHADPNETPPDVGPQSLAFDWNGLDWPTLFQALKARYGVWELARMEAILRLADHRASEEAAARRDPE